MIQLRRAGIALAALALPLGSSLNGGAALAHDREPAAVKQRVDTSSISIDNVTPATIPAKGTIVLTGALRNGSSKTWHHLAVMPQTSRYPITSTGELESDAGLNPNDVALGSSLPELSTALPDLAPGKAVAFTIRIPRAKMSIVGQSGAYWLGVAPTLDQIPLPGVTARTFLPLLPKVNKKARVNIALVVPLRESPLRTTTGALAYASAFTTDLSPRGRLGRIATFGQAAGDRPLTWLVDPALLDLADDSARGTAAYAIGTEATALPHPTPLPTPSGSSTPSSTASPSSTPSSTPSATPTSGPAAAALAARVTSQTWLNSVTSLLQLPASATYALPYADPAVAPLVATGNSALLTAAVDRSTQSMTARGLQEQPAGAPSNGRLSQSEWSALAAGQNVFVGSSATSSGSMASDSRTLIVASPASLGGPGPSKQTSALNLRQRILAEASLAVGGATTTNLTLVLPASWDPGSAAGIRDFFPDLTQPWISFTGLPALSSGTAVLSRTAPRATPLQRASIQAALRLRATASRVMNVLATTPKVTDTLGRQFDATALSTVSYAAASTPIRYRVNATRTVATLDGLLGSVRVEGTQFVTLSGSSGVITVALHNGLNQPIRVGLRQTNREPGSTVSVDPVAAITLDSGERSTLRVNLTAHRVSVQEVTLTAVTAKGVPFGTPLTFTLRSSPVGAVVWAVTIAIALVLTVLVARSVRRRIRLKRRAA
ncbi:MAG: hypothetical protein ACTHJM_04180 [Marmoricola sp.]